jgi:hypothetical protein
VLAKRGEAQLSPLNFDFGLEGKQAANLGGSQYLAFFCRQAVLFISSSRLLGSRLIHTFLCKTSKQPH